MKIKAHNKNKINITNKNLIKIMINNLKWMKIEFPIS